MRLTLVKSLQTESEEEFVNDVMSDEDGMRRNCG